MTDFHLTIEELRLKRAVALLAMEHTSTIEQWIQAWLEALRLNRLVEIGEECEQDWQEAKTA